jgi:hypothetical protein
MAHGLEYDDAYFEERPYEIEYEVNICWSTHS